MKVSDEILSVNSVLTYEANGREGWEHRLRTRIEFIKDSAMMYILGLPGTLIQHW
jgi:hypothetical protein